MDTLAVRPLDFENDSTLPPVALGLLNALVGGKPLTEAAEAAGCNEEEALAFLQDRRFRAALRDVNRVAWQLAVARLQSLVPQAIGTLESLIGDPQIAPGCRYAAARALLDLVYRAEEHGEKYELAQVLVEARSVPVRQHSRRPPF
jgi:hypothetical protein